MESGKRRRVTTFLSLSSNMFFGRTFLGASLWSVMLMTRDLWQMHKAWRADGAQQRQLRWWAQ